MLLVPRQLERAGMTGNVPYYGGRFTPAQAYAASHPRSASTPSPVVGGRVAPGGEVPAAVRPVPPPAVTSPQTLDALKQLLDTGVITAAEHQALLDRSGR